MTHLDQPMLEDVLDMLLVTYGEPTPQAIAEFAERYPAYRSELMEFAAEWALEDHLPEPAPLSPEQEALVFARGQSAFQNIVHAQTKVEAGSAVGRASLAELAKRAGKSLGDIMGGTGLDHGLISKLNGRRIRPQTIPQSLARAIGDFLGLPEAQVTASWTGAPKALAMSFHSRQAQIMPHQEDFDIAVAKSSLSPEHKAKLLQDA
jgi:hypothetical protein